MLFHYKIIIKRKIVTAKIIKFKHSLLKRLYQVPGIRFCSGEIVMQSEFYHSTRNIVVASPTP